MALNIHVDDTIFKLQKDGGISRLWRNLTPHLQRALPDANFNSSPHADIFMSTYYQPAPVGAKSVVMVYDWIMHKYPLMGAHNPDAIAQRQAVASADALIAISQSVADDTVSYARKSAAVAYCGGGETYTRPLPSVVDAFRVRYRLDKPYVLVVGRRGLYKNVQALYQAWRVWAESNNYIVLCVGGEDDLPQDRAFSSHFRWQREVLNSDDLAAAYSGAVALVYPSVFEGFGLPVVEAMGCGCPVIGGEAVKEIAGDALFDCDVYRPLSILDALADVMNPSERVKRVLIGYEQAKRFTWEAMAEQVVAVIRSIL